MYSLKNYSEIIVDDLIDGVINNIPSICTCEKCRMDIKALALNKLKVRYVVSNKGELYKKIEGLNEQVKVDAIEAITEAALLVAKNPKHSSEND